MFRIPATVSGLAEANATHLVFLKAGNTRAMREVTAGLKDELRNQVSIAGLGLRLSYTWQGRTYPQSGDSLEPAAYVYSKAPKIISLFESGATLRPVGGQKYLWIPTQNVPLLGKRGSGLGRLRPDEVERRFGNFFFRGARRGGLLAFVRVRGKAVLMFNLVRAVPGRKRLDGDGAFDRWADETPLLVTRYTSAGSAEV